MLITYPLMTVVDDSGAIVTGATVAVASVTDPDGVAIASPGATLHQAGANVSVAYDAEAKGEAWVTLSISKAGSTFTGLNAAPAFFLSRDPSRIVGNLDSAVSGVVAGVWSFAVANTTSALAVLRALGAVILGKVVESADHTTTTFSDVNDPATTRVTSSQTTTGRTPTLR